MNGFVFDVYPKNIIEGAIILRYTLDSVYKDSEEYCEAILNSARYRHVDMVNGMKVEWGKK